MYEAQCRPRKFKIMDFMQGKGIGSGFNVSAIDHPSLDSIFTEVKDQNYQSQTQERIHIEVNPQVANTQFESTDGDDEDLNL